VLPLGLRWVTQLQNIGINEKPTISILRKSGQSVEVHHFISRPLQRFDQRIREPLRQFVQWQKPAGRVRCCYEGVVPTVTERHTTKPKPRWPNLSEMGKHIGQDRRCTNRVILPVIDQKVEQTARPRRIMTRKDRRVFVDDAAKAMEQSDAAIDSRYRVGLGDLQPAFNSFGGNFRQNGGVYPQGIARRTREQSVLKHGQARKRKAFGSTNCLSTRRVFIAPVRSGSRVKQNADDHEIESRSRAFALTGAAQGPTGWIEEASDLKIKVPPARVQRNIQRRIGSTHRLNHELGHGIQRLPPAWAALLG
jgi:hypothetical protein